jgi:flagellin-specific chaperone FliS
MPTGDGKVTLQKKMNKEKLTAEEIAEQEEITAQQFKSFLEESPLYSKLKVNFSSDFDEPESFDISDYVNAISRECSVCGTKREFKPLVPQVKVRIRGEKKSDYVLEVSGRTTEVNGIRFKCQLCKENLVLFLIEINRIEGWIRKVGQVPSFDISVPKEIAKELGQDAELYKRARMCMSQSHGIGACAYLRRLIENQINPWLQLLYELKEYENADQEELKKIDDAIKAKNFSQKTEIAYQFAPKYLTVKGINPLQQIHKFLSSGLHGLDEDTCTKIAVELSALVEYVVSQLNRENRSKREFLEKIRKLEKSKLFSDLNQEQANS